MKVRIRDLNMRFAAIDVLQHIDLDVAEGEFVCILGPSGCGKSTLLNIIAGFLPPTSGQVAIDGQPVTGPDPRRIFVFQERGVFPWLTVEGNIGFGLFRLSDEEIQYVAHRRFDAILAAEILADRLRLGRRLDDHERLRHVTSSLPGSGGHRRPVWPRERIVPTV